MSLSTCAPRPSTTRRPAAASRLYANGIYGGFTIANGVVIENASSGSGNDTLTGNSGDNCLSAGGGIDSVFGGGGRDTLDGGDGNDTIDGGDGNDTIDGGADHDVARFSGLFSEYTSSTTATAL